MQHSSIQYLGLDLICRMHRDQILKHGGILGVRDLGLLKSAIDEPKATFDQVDLYPELFDKAAATFVLLVKNHPFIDGNKRIGVVVMGMLLSLNGLELIMDPESLYDMAIDIATSKLNIMQVAVILKKNSVRFDLPNK